MHFLFLNRLKNRILFVYKELKTKPTKLTNHLKFLQVDRFGILFKIAPQKKSEEFNSREPGDKISL